MPTLHLPNMKGGEKGGRWLVDIHFLKTALFNRPCETALNQLFRYTKYSILSVNDFFLTAVVLPKMNASSCTNFTISMQMCKELIYQRGNEKE